MPDRRTAQPGCKGSHERPLTTSSYIAGLARQSQRITSTGQGVDGGLGSSASGGWWQFTACHGVCASHGSLAAESRLLTQISVSRLHLLMNKYTSYLPRSKSLSAHSVTLLFLPGRVGDAAAAETCSSCGFLCGGFAEVDLLHFALANVFHGRLMASICVPGCMYTHRLT